jgi:hypothetical protein
MCYASLPIKSGVIMDVHVAASCPRIKERVERHVRGQVVKLVFRWYG